MRVAKKRSVSEVIFRCGLMPSRANPNGQMDDVMTEITQTQDRGVITDADTQSEGKITQLVYIPQALGFIVGITFIAAVIVNYVKRDELTSELQRSHFRWQIRTFWYSVLWTVIGAVTSMVVVGYFILLFAVAWTLYRVIRGWLCLYDGKPMYSKA